VKRNVYVAGTYIEPGAEEGQELPTPKQVR